MKTARKIPVPSACLVCFCFLAAAGTSSAQQRLDEFDVPADMAGSLKTTECPEGDQPGGKGECRKKDREKNTGTGQKAPASERPAPHPTAGAARRRPEMPRASRPPLVPRKAAGSEKGGLKGPGTESAGGNGPVREATAPVSATESQKAATYPGQAVQKGGKDSVEQLQEKDQQNKQAAGKEASRNAANEPRGEDDEAAGGKRQSRRKEFVKGELGDFIGSNKLVTKNNRLGVRLGYRKLDMKHYVTITPEADFRIWKFEVGLGVPLAIEIFDGSWNDQKSEPVGFANAGDLRTEDWNEPGEYIRFLRYLRFGRKEDRVFFNLSQYQSMTLGHGALIRRYNPNIDPDSTRLAFELDMYNDYAGFELMSNDITSWDVLGVLGFLKPLSPFLDGTVAKSLSIGFSYAADRHAPHRLVTQSEPQNPYFVVGDDTPQVSSSSFLHGFGVDMEVKVVKTENVDLKPFVDYSWFIPSRPDGASAEPSGGGGFTIGLLGRFNFGAERVHALRTIAEFRTFSGDYLPGYFDTLYEVQKYMLNTHYSKYAADGGLPPTKFEDVFYNRSGEGRKYGFYLEFNYSLIGYFTFTFSLEGSNAPAGNNLLAHVEVPALGWLQFFASYHHRAADGLGELFGSGGDQVIFAAARLRLLPFLFVNFSYHYTFELRDDYADLTGDGLEEHYRLYDKMHGWLADFELGWEF